MDAVVHLDGLVVGPGQWLVLLTRTPMTNDQMWEIQESIPAELRGRVLVVDSLDGYVVDAVEKHAGVAS